MCGGKTKTEQFWWFIAAEARAERRQQLVGEVVAVASEAMQHDHGGRVLPRWCDDVWRRQCACGMGPVGLVTDRLPANAEDRPSSTFILRLFMAMADERRASFGAWADSPTLVMPRPVVMRRSRSRPDGISSTRQDSRLRRFVIVIFCFTFVAKL